jgi:hypothetical protein
VDHPLPWLRYVDADRVTAPDFAFDGMKVRNDEMETLGKVHGFIVDNASMRPYYVVVDSGGWFKSKHFLVPIGHARIDADRDAIVVDIAKSRIENFPGFDRGEFQRLGDDEIRRMNDQICQACSGEIQANVPTDPLSPAWSRPDYTQPDWWSRVAVRDISNVSAGTAYVPPTVVGATGELQAERELERELEREQVVAAANVEDRDLDRNRDRDRDRVAAHEADPSPHFDGRAQPGDVVGFETGGERTHIGETREDENKRRSDAERAYRKETEK